MSPVHIIDDDGNHEIPADDIPALQLTDDLFFDAYSDPFPVRLDTSLSLFTRYPMYSAHEMDVARRERLKQRYFKAMEFLMTEAARHDLDASTIYTAGKLSHDLFGKGVSQYLVAPDLRLPECLGGLPPEQQAIFAAADRTVVRLVARANAEAPTAPKPSLRPVPVRVKFPGVGEMPAQYVSGPDPRLTYLQVEIAHIWRTMGPITTADDPSLTVRFRVKSPDGGAWRTTGLITTADDAFLSACACDFQPDDDDQPAPPTPNRRATATPAARKTKRPRPRPPTILSLGNREYRIGKSHSVRLTGQQDTLLQFFLTEKAAFSLPELESALAIVSSPTKVMKAICTKCPAFTPAVQFPGIKGSGKGYFIRVVAVAARTARKKTNPSQQNP